MICKYRSQIEWSVRALARPTHTSSTTREGYEGAPGYALCQHAAQLVADVAGPVGVSTSPVTDRPRDKPSSAGQTPPRASHPTAVRVAASDGRRDALRAGNVALILDRSTSGGAQESAETVAWIVVFMIKSTEPTKRRPLPSRRDVQLAEESVRKLISYSQLP